MTTTVERPAPTPPPRAGFVLYVGVHDDPDGGPIGARELAEVAETLRDLARELLPTAETFTALSLVPQRAGTDDVRTLRDRLSLIIEREGKTLAALNAALFAGRVSNQVAERIADARRELADKVIRQYCIAKAVAVALNPIPVADLLAAGALDAALVMHLGRVYGLPLTKSEAGALIAAIFAQLAALMGAIWGVHLVASALKGVSAGLSTVVTAGAQGALAWYATELVGRIAERYLVAGKSWGEKGPKRVVAEIVASLDRDSILREARAEILARLRRSGAKG